MRRPYSQDLRRRVVRHVEAGHSRRAAGRSFRGLRFLRRQSDDGLSASLGGSLAPKPLGGRRHATSSSWTICRRTKVRSPRKPSTTRAHGFCFCRPTAPISTRSRWLSQNSRPSARQSRPHHRRSLESHRPNLRSLRAPRTQKLLRRRRIWIQLNVRRPQLAERILPSALRRKFMTLTVHPR
jgi:hypothetical protein